MAKKLDQILIIDVESTCWEGPPPPEEESEIIEIGVCLLEVATGERLGVESILVKPERSRVSPFCTGLTTLTQSQVEGGVSFQEACSRLKRHYLGQERTWASYGDYDRRQFERQCRARQVGYPLGATHLNVKNLFALKHKLSREVGMAEALTQLNLPLVGTHHRGADDAWNIAQILASML